MFPRRIVVNKVPLRCGVYSDRMMIGCVSFSREVIGNLLDEMKDPATPDYKPTNREDEDEHEPEKKDKEDLHDGGHGRGDSGPDKSPKH